jgi:predicted metal-dependent phosphoesterase TrpH
MIARLILHIHSEYSPDASAKPADILSIAEREHLQAIAIADHDSIEGSMVAQTLQSNVLVIPAAEITTDRGHILGLCIKTLPQTAVLSEVLLDIRRQGGISIVAHPLRKNSGLSAADLDTYKDQYDGIEIYNPKNTPYGNLVGYQRAQAYKKIMVAGSDAHRLETIPRTSIEVEINALTLENIKAALLNKPLTLRGDHVPPCHCTTCTLMTTVEPFIHNSRWYNSVWGKRIGYILYLPIRRLIYDKRKKSV